MNQYIVNLTDNLIGRHRLDERFRRTSKSSFVTQVTDILEFDDVKKMNPETLGRVLCSLETGDVAAGKSDLFSRLHFSGDPGETLRELVSICLAYVIHSRLDPGMQESQIPRYKSTRNHQRQVREFGEKPTSDIARESEEYWCPSCNGDQRICGCEPG